MIDFFSLLEFSQIRAINLALTPTIESIWMMRCREYSVKFHTPLDRVINELDPLFVLDALNQEKYHPSLVEEELEELLDRLYIIKDPSYSKMSKEETESLVDAVINKETTRLSKKKKPTQESIQADIKTAESNSKVGPHQPKSGGMNFTDLERMESQLEANKGFKD